MGFKTEEELEAWFAAEKERLSEEFLNRINHDKTTIPKHRAKFDAEMKKLIVKYNADYERLLAQQKKKVLKKKA
jgi:formyltetrahydrofolate hydrolase